MNNSQSTRGPVNIEISIRMPSGLVQLNSAESLLLPPDVTVAGSRLAYGPYLRAIAGYLSANSYRALRTVLARQPFPAPRLRESKSIRLISEKHGALYSVSRLEVEFENRTFSFAVNTAFSPEQQAFLHHEHTLLKTLYKRFQHPFLPRPFLAGSTTLHVERGVIPIALFVAEWFEDFHEFHLSRPKPGEGTAGDLALHLWKPEPAPFFLDPGQTAELYRQAAAILTAYLDAGSFKQIYPWHHAAGDFIVRTRRRGIEVRLITARSYRCLLPGRTDAENKPLGLLHFFINLAVRMRLDRLDGTGDLVWAPPSCLPHIIRGFCEIWEKRRHDDPIFPGVEDIFSLFLQFSREERLAFTEIVQRDGQVESDEAAFLLPLLPQHVADLAAAMKRALEES